MVTNKTINVLLADDDPRDHQNFHAVLIASGHNVKIESVYDGVKLLDYLLSVIAPKNPKNTMPDLIITDLYMPFAGGLQVLKQIKHSIQFKHIPIYVFSGINDNMVRTKVLENGATEFHYKTGSLDELKITINSILEKHAGILPDLNDLNQAYQRT